MKIVDEVAEEKRKQDYCKKVVDTFEKSVLFEMVVSEYVYFVIKLFERRVFWFFKPAIARIRIDYEDNEIDAKVRITKSFEQLDAIKSALKEIEALRKKTKVTLTIVEDF